MISFFSKRKWKSRTLPSVFLIQPISLTKGSFEPLTCDPHFYANWNYWCTKQLNLGLMKGGDRIELSKGLFCFYSKNIFFRWERLSDQLQGGRTVVRTGKRKKHTKKATVAHEERRRPNVWLTFGVTENISKLHHFLRQWINEAINRVN